MPYPGAILNRFDFQPVLCSRQHSLIFSSAKHITMAATLPRPNGTRSGIAAPQSSMRKVSQLARPSTPSRMSSIGQTGVLSTSKSLQKSVSIANFPQPPKGLRISLSPPSALSANRRLSSLTKGSTSPTTPSHLRNSDDEKHNLRRLTTRKSTSNLNSHKRIDESGLLSILPSPPPSRSGSSQGTYASPKSYESTSDGAQVIRGGGGGGNESGSKETKGNVIISVRCRPDPNGDNGECPFAVDGPNKKVIHRGGEGDYVYGMPVFQPTI